MSTWQLVTCSADTITLERGHYTAELQHNGHGGLDVVLTRRKVQRRDRIAYAGPLVGRYALTPKSVDRVALTALASEYPMHVLPYVVHALQGMHGAWCLEQCAIPCWSAAGMEAGQTG
jgi:hypothetical protein